MKSISLLIFSSCILLTVPLAAQDTQKNDEQKCVDLSGDEAIAACTRAIDSHSLPQKNLANSYYNRGVEYRKKNEFDMAISDYNEAIQLDPSLVKAYNNRAGCWYNKGEYDRALPDYEKALQLDPRHVNSYYGLGSVYQVQGAYSKAIDNYNEALKINPDFAGAFMYRGLTYSEMGAYAMALADYKDAIRLKSGDHYLPLLMAVAKMHTGDNAIAGDLNDEVQAPPNNWPMPVVQFYLGKLNVDELMAAARDPNAAVQQARLCEMHFYLGEWQLFHGQKMQGLENLKAAQSSCSQTAPAYVVATNDLNQRQ